MVLKKRIQIGKFKVEVQIKEVAVRSNKTTIRAFARLV